MRSLFIIFSSFLFLSSCASIPKGPFVDYPLEETPDYSLSSHWAALPTMVDNADRTPPGFKDQQDIAKVDVFYLHPTNYFGDKEFRRWNAEIDNEEVNKSVDEKMILFQATVFNSVGKIYAPRYRQAHLQAYYTRKKAIGKKALDVAYSDVKNAFQYYLDHYNKGRPFIILSHSQGTTHAARLLKEFIDGKPLEKKLIAAYLIGIPIDLDQYTHLKPCENENDLGCLIGGRTWKKGSVPKLLKKEKPYRVLVTNPLSWKTNTDYVAASKNKGTVLFDFDAEPIQGLIDAQIHESILWTTKPKFKGSILYFKKNYHRGDINLYYVNMRENAEHKVAIYFNNM
jgi:hypothetical protein